MLLLLCSFSTLLFSLQPLISLINYSLHPFSQHDLDILFIITEIIYLKNPSIWRVLVYLSGAEAFILVLISSLSLGNFATGVIISF